MILILMDSLGLRPDVGNDLLELVERRGQPDRRGAPTVLEMRRRAVRDDAVFNREIEGVADHCENRIVVACALISAVARQPC